MKQVTLIRWAERFDPVPHENTLRNWAREGKIYPSPIKIGRSYYVKENAIHVEEIANGTTISLN
jgi:hypothetical protein